MIWLIYLACVVAAFCGLVHVIRKTDDLTVGFLVYAFTLAVIWPIALAGLALDGLIETAGRIADRFSGLGDRVVWKRRS